MLNGFQRYPRELGLLLRRAALAGWLAFSPVAVTSQPWVVFALTIITAVFVARSAYGQDGTDQMGWVTSVALSAALAVGTPLALRAYLYFLAGQTVISYSAAEYAKLVAAKWRDGSYLPAIFRITGYGHAGLARALEAQPALRHLLAASLLTWECSFFLVLFCPPARRVTVPRLRRDVPSRGRLLHGPQLLLLGLHGHLPRDPFSHPTPALLTLSCHRPAPSLNSTIAPPALPGTGTRL